ncbi:MAG: hypothetical protein GY775_18165, partial [Candidatus Scalindua sp.]|nr:hypothetical protein [Candidatus Scalindua sp.]
DEEGYHAQMAELGMEESLINIIQSRNSTILLQKIETKGTHAATAGEINIEIFEDYRHVPVLSAYAPLEIEGVDWAIMAEIDEEEALRASTTLGKRMMMISVVLLFVIIGLSLLVLRITGKITNVIKRMVTSLNDCSVQISDASEQISSASQTLAQGSSEQASSLEETSASMEEMSAMTKQNVLNAEETFKLVEVCNTAAGEGNKAAVEVSNSMEEITIGSKKIAEITKIIDGIAAQTGTLATKAGVDTAQVIGQGNSFAVVAKEVKNLAHKSMDAAKDTKNMVEDCISNVDEVINDTSMYKNFKEKINKIAEGIDVMDEMASQTNTIANKVAEDTVQVIEQGNSFATAAKEITNHAQKSTATAKDTKTLIEDCIANAYEFVADASEDNKDTDNSISTINKYNKFKENINKIAERIDVMDDMAEQTNTLALKVVEDAALIVEQGNSFDAAAKEVRDLSQKSTVAAMDTKTATQYCITKSDEAVNNAIKYENYKGNIEKIVNGIDLIDGIASQSNLLALNAAVEAAHASDNGEKFAAVAEEIRGLAKKCTDAARDTTVLVGECVQKASDGTKIANKCKDTMESIVNDVQRASVLTNEIKEASSEQSEGIVQVTNAVQQMDQVTQQNAANAEETASASEELSAQAHTMKEQVDILAMQVGGKGDGELPPEKSDKESAGKVDNETTDKVSEQQIKEKKKSGSKIFKLLLSPIFILQSIVKRKNDNDSDKVTISESTGSSETAPDVDNNTGGNGHGNEEDVLVKIASNESLIPMGENRIQAEEEAFKDF